MERRAPGKSRLVAQGRVRNDVRREQPPSLDVLGEDMRARRVTPTTILSEVDVKDVVPDVLGAYVAFLGLGAWYERWARANPRVAARRGKVRGRPNGRS
jgi:hypothetical protein